MSDKDAKSSKHLVSKGVSVMWVPEEFLGNLGDFKEISRIFRVSSGILKSSDT